MLERLPQNGFAPFELSRTLRAGKDVRQDVEEDHFLVGQPISVILAPIGVWIGR
jgi:hypothetical protein